MNSKVGLRTKYSETKLTIENSVPFLRWIQRAQPCKLFIGLIVGCISLTPLAHGQQQVGARTPFTTLEAEAGTLGGGATIRSFVLGSSVPNNATLELEASGGGLVEFNANGQSVSWINPVDNANTIVIRDSIPDALNGGGITATINLYVDGVFRQAITLSSKQSWNYNNSRTTPDDPKGGGTPWHFYNEDRAFITGTPIAAGSTITLQKDAENTAVVYDIDCIDLEFVHPPRAQPANSLSILSYGADPTFTTDSTIAIQKCINDARTQGKSVWIPPGKYMVASLASTPLSVTGVTVNGAGMWYSMIYRNVPLPAPANWRSEILVGSGATVRDLSIDSDTIYRGLAGAGGDDYGINASGSGGWLIERIWVQHCDAQWLTGSNGTIQNSRVADSWADSINLNDGNTPDPNKAGLNLTAQNNFVRGGGDDGIATYSDSGSSGLNTEMDGTHILNNTSVAPYWANALRVAGGKNVVVRNNLATDPAANNGMDVSVFGTTGHPVDSATISGNVILRGGGWNGTNRHGMNVASGTGTFASSYTNATLTRNTIRDSRRAGLNIGPALVNLTTSCNFIDHPAVQGIWIRSGVTGAGLFDSDIVTNLNTGQVAFQNDSPNTFTAAQTDTSLQQCQQPVVVNGTIQLVTTANFVKLVDGSYQAAVTVSNVGTGTAQQVVLMGITLGASAGTPTPQTLLDIAPGDIAFTTLYFPSSAGVSGATVLERITGTYTGGTFGGTIRAVLP
jgi:hypothetical protein